MGAAYLVQTLQIAGVIALGVFMVDSLVEIIGKKNKRRENNQSQVKNSRCSMGLHLYHRKEVMVYSISSLS